ncbi:protein kinase [Pseudanabaena sp. FACHB-1277]|uniref:non-specific serine/threonine protein kinase n=1 Tax=Pseudanabaena cinerea FACHB-1277 TaxID=2949581 RepID=A0A926Z4I1_9CYAN|nr:serine/threonine-protein kinase [Pseudanabaena cinerea]MBD2149241.1 protein kinase [Pseudanabaena cinerea FACHB-1277]
MLNTILRGHYKIVRHLGGGGFGQTYLAEDIDLPTHPICVVKHLKPISNETFVLETAKRLFDQEAEILYALGSHDRIPRLLAHFQEGKDFYLVQEFADGHDLTQEIGNGKRSPETAVTKLLKEVLEILVFVHGRNVVHRDIKPANLIRRKADRQIVLIDFGAVKEIGGLAADAQGSTNLTIAIGSPGYMPIEQLNGKPRFSSDIYAVGMMAIQAITGAEPRLFPEHPETAELIWRDRLQGSYSSQFLDILDKMVRYDFRQRYQNAQDVLQAIEQINSNSDLPTVVHSSDTNQNTSQNTNQNTSQNTDSPPTPSPAAPSIPTNPHSTVVLSNSSSRQMPPLWLLLAGGAGLVALLSIIFVKLSKPPIPDIIANSPSVPLSLPVPPPVVPPINAPIAIPTPSQSTPPSVIAAPSPPLSVEDLLAQALVLNRNNKPQEALAKVEVALKIEPDNIAAWRTKVLLLRTLGRKDEAIAAFAKVLELKPDERDLDIPNLREPPFKKTNKQKN